MLPMPQKMFNLLKEWRGYELFHARGFIFYDRPIIKKLDFEVNFFCHCSIAFGALKVLYIHSWRTCTNQTTSWLMHSWSTFGARTNHIHTWTHKTHHGPDFFFVILFVISHEGYIQMSFYPKTPNLGVLKFSKLGLLLFWKPIIFCANLQLKWSLKQSFILHRDFSKDMWHATCTQVSQGESRFFCGWESNWHFDSRTLFLAITCVLSTQMGCANAFYTFTFQDLSNDIMNFSI